jgi:hypothetical protein
MLKSSDCAFGAIPLAARKSLPPPIIKVLAPLVPIVNIARDGSAEEIPIIDIGVLGIRQGTA